MLCQNCFVNEANTNVRINDLYMCNDCIDDMDELDFVIDEWEEEYGDDILFEKIPRKRKPID